MRENPSLSHYPSSFASPSLSPACPLSIKTPEGITDSHGLHLLTFQFHHPCLPLTNYEACRDHHSSMRGHHQTSIVSPACVQEDKRLGDRTWCWGIISSVCEGTMCVHAWSCLHQQIYAHAYGGKKTPQVFLFFVGHLHPFFFWDSLSFGLELFN